MKRLISAISAIAMALTLIVAVPPTPALAAVTSGTYYIRNVGVSLFVGASVYTANNSARTQNLSTTTDQSWVIQQHSSGYYTIKTNNADLYLTVQNNSSALGASVVLSACTNNTFTDGQLWSITSMNGWYRISPKCASNYMLGVAGNAAPYNGATLVTISYYAADGFNYELWSLEPVTNTLTLSIFYDDDFRARYSPNLVAKINNCVNPLNYRLVVDAGINIRVIEYPLEVDIYSDSDLGCNALNGYNVMCSCAKCEYVTASSLKTYHHTNIDNVLYRLANNTNADIKVVFTGHEMCIEDRLDNHIDNLSEYAVFYKSNKSRNVILMKDFKTMTSHDTVVFANAVLELYGLNVHAGSQIDGFSEDCVWGANALSDLVRDGCTLCDKCIEILQQNADEY